MTWTSVWSIFPFFHPWMVWNLFLALIPLLLSLWLFHKTTTRNVFWWAGLLGFMAFLPNAPYVLTDLIHLVYEVQDTESVLFSTLIIIPRYALFVLLGFEAYVVALLNLEKYLKRQGWATWVIPTELALHGLSAIGVYLGRIERFNSWDLLTNPGHVLAKLAQSVMTEELFAFVLLGLGVIAVLYWPLKQITQALILQQEYATTLRRQSNHSETANH